MSSFSFQSTDLQSSYLFYESPEFLSPSYLRKGSSYKINSYWYDQRKNLVLGDFIFSFFNGLRTFYHQDSSLLRHAQKTLKPLPVNSLSLEKPGASIFFSQDILALSLKSNLFFLRPPVFLLRNKHTRYYSFFPRIRQVVFLNQFYLFHGIKYYQRRPYSLFPLMNSSLLYLSKPFSTFSIFFLVL